MAWAWNLSLICILSETRSLTKECLAARRQSHVDAWNSALRPGTLFVEANFWLIIAWPDVSLIFIRSLISKSLGITIEPEVSSTSNSCCMSFRLKVCKQWISRTLFHLLLYFISYCVSSIIILHNGLFSDMLGLSIWLPLYLRDEHWRASLDICFILFR